MPFHAAGEHKMGIMKYREQNLISIIMPAYHAEATLKTAVESVIAQTYSQWELIIVDDASGDATAELAQEYAACDSRIRVLTLPCNSGAARARQAGIDAAGGQWIAFLDSDDAWRQDKLYRQMQIALQKNAGLVYTGSAYMDAAGNLLNWTLHVPSHIGYRRLLKQNLISNSSVLIRKEVYCRYAVSRSDLHEDFVCWLRFLRDDGMACGIDEPMLVYRLSPFSKSGNKLKSAGMAWRAYREVGLNPLKSMYYMAWYTVTGILKYRHLKTRKDTLQ